MLKASNSFIEVTLHERNVWSLHHRKNFSMLCRPAICSHSLGRAWKHELPAKLDAASRHGLDIELFFEDLYYVAKDLPGGPTTQNQLAAAHIVHSLCDERGISVVCLQPFMHYEGLRDRQEHVRRIDEMKLWIEMAHILQTSIIAIPSTCQSEELMSGDLDLIVRDLQEVADIAALEGIELAYESLAWGTYSDTWEQAWKIVTLVDRSNFGICLDTFNLAGRVYADPARTSGKTPTAECDIRASVNRLVASVDVSKIVFVQVVDAERLAEPLVEGHEYHDAEQPARMSWSRNCRLFYGEEERGAYLPVKMILQAILVDLGFRGWVSAELFNKSLMDDGADVPESHARRAAESWDKIVRDFGLQETEKPRRVLSEPFEHAPRAQL